MPAIKVFKTHICTECTIEQWAKIQALALVYQSGNKSNIIRESMRREIIRLETELGDEERKQYQQLVARFLARGQVKADIRADAKI